MESEGLCSRAVLGATSSASSVEIRCAAGLLGGQINETRDSAHDPGRADSGDAKIWEYVQSLTTYVPDWNANVRFVVREQPTDGVYVEGEHTWAVCRSDVLAS